MIQLSWGIEGVISLQELPSLPDMNKTVSFIEDA